MKTVLRFLILSLILFNVTSCEMYTGMLITDEDFGERLELKLKKEIPSEAHIARIDFQMHRFSFGVNTVMVYYFNSGDDKILHNMLLSVSGSVSKMKEDYMLNLGRGLESENAIPLSDIDFSRITSSVKEAIFIVEEAGILSSGVESYTIESNKNKNKILHKFTISSKGATVDSKRQGHNTVTTVEYSVFNFAVEGAGQLVIIE